MLLEVRVSKERSSLASVSQSWPRTPEEQTPVGSRAKKGSSGVCSGSGAEWGGSAGRRLGRWARTGPQPRAALRLVSEVWPARGWGMGGEQRLCWGRTKGEDKDYFKPVLITAPNRDWGWEPQLS